MSHLIRHPRGSAVVVTAASRLRCAGLASLLQDWARANRLSILTVMPGQHAEFARLDEHIATAVVDVGSASLRESGNLNQLKALAEVTVNAPLIVVSEIDELGEIVAAYRAGARAFIPMSTPPSLALAALSFIIEGGTFFPQDALLNASSSKHLFSNITIPAPLTQRQLSVLAHVQAGKTNKAIARMLGVGESTVKEHISIILRKIGAKNRTEAALSAVLLPVTEADDQWLAHDR